MSNRKYNYTIQCDHPDTGKTGCWVFQGDNHRQIGTSISPVFPDVAMLFDWMRKNGFESASGLTCYAPIDPQFISPHSGIMSLMTGAVYCRKGHTVTELHYEDGEVEIVNTRDLPPIDWENWFSIVSGIQSLRSQPKDTETYNDDQKMYLTLQSFKHKADRD